jgi:HEAT repeat protein
MATERRLKAASSCSSDQSRGSRGALVAFVAGLTVSLALVHDCSTSRDEPSMQAAPASPSGLRAQRVEEEAAASTQRAGFSLERARPAAESPDVRPAIELLRVALSDSDVKVRLHAVAALADVDVEQAGEMLAATILSDAEAEVRREAVAALAERRGTSEMQAIEQALLDPDQTVREVAIEAFVAIGGEASALALAPLVHHRDPALRLQVVDALAEIGGPVAVNSLRQALTDGEPAIRRSATELLADVSDERR